MTAACGTDNTGIISDTWMMVDYLGAQPFNDFNTAMCDAYELVEDDMTLVPTGVAFPQIPALCTGPVQDKVAELLVEDQKLSQCLAK